LNRAPWYNLPIPPTPPGTATNRNPSPPNLFNEFQLYQKIAPDFMNSYPYLVSQAGKRDPSQKSMIKVKAKVERKVPQKVPFR
jgi:hypothetical protein